MTTILRVIEWATATKPRTYALGILSLLAVTMAWRLYFGIPLWG